MGQLVEQGPVEEMLMNPQHDYTKRLMTDVSAAPRQKKYSHPGVCGGIKVSEFPVNIFVIWGMSRPARSYPKF